MRRNPQRLAWIVLLLAFAGFCLIVVGVPLGAKRYVQVAQKGQDILVESLAGTVLVTLPISSGPVPLSRGENMSVPEGTTVRVDDTSEAVLTFFDHSTMHLYPGSTVRLITSRAPRYRSGLRPNTVALELSGGRAYVGTALSLDYPLDFVVDTVQAQMRLGADGSYAIEARNDLAAVSAYRGSAEVATAQGSVTLNAREHTEVALGQAPAAVTGVAQELIVNGEFREPLSETWRFFNDQGADGGDVDGRSEVVVDEGRRAIKLYRTGGQGNHCETVLEQSIDQKLSDPISSLIVRATVKVRYQSLSGGGYLSSEYPLMIRIRYRDAYDSEAEWVQGFYIQNVDGSPTTDGLQIPDDRWYPYESENLLDSLPIRPYRIISVRVYASGWDYESLIGEISLTAE
jgi:hypothetical protein